jgi:dynein assembly factor 3
MSSRESGIAFESRFSTYPTPNRTLSSYLPGRKKQTHESCLVRGFWGDIAISPYIAFGTWTDVQPEKDLLFKIANK